MESLLPAEKCILTLPGLGSFLPRKNRGVFDTPPPRPGRVIIWWIRAKTLAQIMQSPFLRIPRLWRRSNDGTP